MKAVFAVAALSALVGSAAASNRHAHAHAHDLFHNKRDGNDTGICTPGCTTIYTTITGEYIWTPTPAPSTSTVLPTTTSSLPVTVPTPIAHTCPTPGTYTFPATTVTLTETTTVCAASTTSLPSGTHTVGGVTTVVTTETTVTCPYATTTTSSGVVTSVIETTTYVCPSSGTYTIAPVTVTVTDTETLVVIPVVTTYCPGTYTAPAVVTTITETDYVVYCPFTSPAPAPTVTATATATSSSSPKNTQPASGNTSGVGASGDKWAVTYTPYTPGGDCKTAAQVLSDIQSIAAAGFKAVRVYSTDCNTLPNVGAACSAAGLKMIVGVFITDSGCTSSTPEVQEQITALVQWAQWELVEIVVVANEAVFNGYCSASQLATLIGEVKGALSGAGYTGPCTTTDVVSAWLTEGMSALCDVIDMVAANIHGYFNAETLAANAGAFVEGQLELVEAVCNKPGVVMECGWPTEGLTNGKAIPGVSEQASALSSIQALLGGKVVFFSWTNDPWKPQGACECERFFGCSSFWGQ